MKLWLAAFTAAGVELMLKVARGLAGRGEKCDCFCRRTHLKEGVLPLEGELTAWMGEAFSQADGIIVVGACGIAVRAAAPHLRSKAEDPAVVALDEGGRFAVSLLSGHIGGANRLARLVAELTGAIPVITTATDLHGRFSVDDYAARHGLQIGELSVAKEISARILAGEPVGLQSDFPVDGPLPDGVIASAGLPVGFYLTFGGRPNPFPRTLTLTPRVLTLGIGCRKGIGLEAVQLAVTAALKRIPASIQAVARVCSIDLKRSEPGLVAFCERHQLPLETFSARELRAVPGRFTVSEFVRSSVGVDNVCERAAVLGSGGGELIDRKHASGGVTVAVAAADWRGTFEDTDGGH